MNHAAPPVGHMVHVGLDRRGYDVVVGQGLLARAATFDSLGRRGSAAIVTNAVVGPLLAERVEHALEGRFRKLITVTLPDGEAHKDWASLDLVFSAMLAAGCDRGTTVIALGGGVTGDIAGFAAACYMRGINHVQLPTTLLAQVDSSVGGKTAINHPAGKNMVGAFHQPELVVADVDVLSTLPTRQLVAGIAEVIKYGAVLDDEFLIWIEQNLPSVLGLDADALIHAVVRSCEIKAAVVAADEREAGPRALLNFGHTFGHAIEAAMGFGTWLHGEAVGCGMVLAARLSHRLGLIADERSRRLEAIIQRAGLPTVLPALDPRVLIGHMRVDKKSVDGDLRFVLLTGETGATVAAAPEDLVEQVICVGQAPR